MTGIQNLTGSGAIGPGDKLPLYGANSGRTRSVAMSELVAYLKTSLAPVSFVMNSSTRVGTITLGDGTVITGTVDNGGAIVPGTFELTGQAGSGAYVSNAMPSSFTQLYIASFQFLNAAGQQVTPTAGTVTIQASNDGVNYFSTVNGVFNAVDTYLATRAQTSAVGPVTFLRVTVSGVTGNAVTSFRTLITRA